MSEKRGNTERGQRMMFVRTEKSNEKSRDKESEDARNKPQPG
jgi:hypothetical protein